MGWGEGGTEKDSLVFLEYQRIQDTYCPTRVEAPLARNGSPRLGVGAVVQASAQPQIPRSGDGWEQSSPMAFGFSISLWGGGLQRVVVKRPREGTTPTPAES